MLPLTPFDIDTFPKPAAFRELGDIVGLNRGEFFRHSFSGYLQSGMDNDSQLPIRTPQCKAWQNGSFADLENSKPGCVQKIPESKKFDRHFRFALAISAGGYVHDVVCR